MDRPSRSDELKEQGHRQNLTPLSEDFTTNKDLNGVDNARALRRAEDIAVQHTGHDPDLGPRIVEVDEAVGRGSIGASRSGVSDGPGPNVAPGPTEEAAPTVLHPRQSNERAGDGTPALRSDADGQYGKSRGWRQVRDAIITFAKFIGPGMMIAVAYSKSRPHNCGCLGAVLQTQFTLTS